MIKLWQQTGRAVFWVSWPFWFVYLRIGRRTRVLIVCKDKLVVTRNWLGDGKWSLPGGGLHRNENAKVGAIREVLEETGLGLQPRQLQKLGEAVSSKRGLHFKFVQFLVSYGELSPLIPHSLEISEARWLPQAKLNQSNTETASLATIDLWKKEP